MPFATKGTKEEEERAEAHRHEKGWCGTKFGRAPAEREDASGIKTKTRQAQYGTCQTHGWLLPRVRKNEKRKQMDTRKSDEMHHKAVGETQDVATQTNGKPRWRGKSMQKDGPGE